MADSKKAGEIAPQESLQDFGHLPFTVISAGTRGAEPILRASLDAGSGFTPSIPTVKSEAEGNDACTPIINFNCKPCATIPKTKFSFIFKRISQKERWMRFLDAMYRPCITNIGVGHNMGHPDKNSIRIAVKQL